MAFLADFSVMNPSLGFLFWTSIIFILVWLVLGSRFKVIRNALKNREDSIDKALHQAELARKEMENLKSKHKDLEKQAREDRLRILKEATEIKEEMLQKAKEEAIERKRDLLANAEEEIQNRRKEMEVDLYNEVGKIAIAIAEQVIRRELEDNHEAFVGEKIEEFKKEKLVANC